MMMVQIIIEILAKSITITYLRIKYWFPMNMVLWIKFLGEAILCVILDVTLMYHMFLHYTIFILVIQKTLNSEITSECLVVWLLET